MKGPSLPATRPPAMDSIRLASLQINVFSERRPVSKHYDVSSYGTSDLLKTLNGRASLDAHNLVILLMSAGLVMMAICNKMISQVATALF